MRPQESADAAQRFLEQEVVPRLRGLLHAWALWFALSGGAVLVLLAPTGRARAAALIYSAGLVALFAASSIYHRWRGDARWRPMLRRIDHSTIFVFIAASYTPVALLVLESPLGTIVLACVWGGALMGVGFTVFWIEAPRALVAGCYLAVGWVAVIALPQLLDRMPVPALVLLLAGGLLYSLGASVYAAKRPDPWPRTFGFHEVFHALVVAAVAVHFAAFAGWVVPAG